MGLEFKEFDNPEAKDYDIASSLKGKDSSKQLSSSPYIFELIELVGILEDGEWLQFEISEEEYMHPTKETIDKVRMVIENRQPRGR